MKVDVARFSPGQDIAELAKPWQELQSVGGVLHPMYSWEWVSAWWDIFGEDRSLVSYTAREGGQALAIAPFALHEAQMNGPFQFQRMELLGTGEDEEEEVYAEYLDIPVHPHAAEGVAEELVGEVLAGQDDSWDDIILHRLRPDSHAQKVFPAAAEKAGLDATVIDSGESPFVQLPDSLDEYMSSLGKKRRYQIRRSIRDLEEIGEISFEKAGTVEEALGALAILGELHQARWEARGKPGVFAKSRFGRFQETFIRRTFGLGWPELWTLRVDGDPIASRYNLRFGKSIFCYVSGMRLLDNRRIQPGIIAHYLAIENAIETGAQEYDFLMGEQSYKLSLSNASRELVSIRIARGTLKESLRRLAVRGAGLVRGLRGSGEDDES